jgi:HPt (histidine-containing phosphotransfer) domain-containing protein
MKTDELLDKTLLISIVDGNTVLLKQLVSLYFGNLPRLMSEIKAGIDAGDAQKLSFNAHALKGMSYNLAATAVADTAYELEKMGKENNLSEAAAAYALLEKQAQSLKIATDKFLKEIEEQK